MKLNVIFRRIANNHNKMRDDIIKGQTEHLPKLGESFTMTGPPRDSGDFRWVNTSPITEIIFSEGDFTTFKTASGSIYSVEVTNE